jgi:hypothetical protein
MASILIDKLLQTVVNRKASDLHITVGQPPVIRADGRLLRLETKVLEPEDTTALMKSITPERCQQELQEVGGSDFGFALRGSYSYTGANNLDPQTSTTALSDEENLQGLAVGGGLQYGGTGGGFGLSLDYAYKYLGILGPSNFYSFSIGW